MWLENKDFFAKGKRGFVSTALLDGRKVLVKEKNPSAAIDTVAHEALMNKRLNELGVGPQFIAFVDGLLVREFVDGDRIEDFLQSASALEAKEVIRESLRQCRVMDVAGINKFEMTHPYKHILVSRVSQQQFSENRTPSPEQQKPSPKPCPLRIVMIDFERCKYTQKPKNVTQFCQYIARIAPLLASRGVFVDVVEVKRLGMRYKLLGCDVKVFELLLELFG